MDRGYERTVNTGTTLSHGHTTLGMLFWISAISCQTPCYPHSLTGAKMERASTLDYVSRSCLDTDLYSS